MRNGKKEQEIKCPCSVPEQEDIRTGTGRRARGEKPISGPGAESAIVKIV
jgi:hypothetical protein